MAALEAKRATVEPVEYHRARAMVAAYFWRWLADRDDWDCLQVEGQFSGQIAQGKIDGLERKRSTGQAFLWELKTASDEIATVGDDYWQRLALDVQIAIYHAEQEAAVGEELGVLYDVLRVPGGKPKMKERIARRKAETEEQYEARKAAALETLEEFEVRLFNEMIGDQDKYLVRREVHVRRDERDAIVAEFAEDSAALATYIGSYPRNDSACKSRFGTCPYLGVCCGAESLDSERFVKVDSKHTELASASQEEAQDDYSASCPL
jgi:hypothetical protein